MYFYLSLSIPFFFGKKTTFILRQNSFVKTHAVSGFYIDTFLMTEHVFDVQINKKQTEVHKETAKEYILP